MLRYIDRLAPESLSAAFALGSAVHATLGWVIEAWWDERRPSEEELAKTFRADWTAETTHTGVVLEPEEAAKTADLGLRLVRAGVERLATQTAGSLRSEVEVQAELWDPVGREILPVPLLGYLDFVGDDFIGEIKTVSRKTGWRHWGLQLGAYAWSWQQRSGRAPEVRVLTLLKTAEVSVNEERLTVPRPEVAWTLEVISSVYRSLSRSAFHPNPSFACARCEHRRACRP